MKPCIKCGSSDRNKQGACKPCKLEISRVYRAVNKEKCDSTKAKWRAENPEYNSKYYAENSKEQIANAKKWASNNPDKAKSSKKKWVQANREKMNAAGRIYDNNRRVRKLTNGGKLSKGLAGKLFKLQQGKCACCRGPLEKYHLDHMMPIVRGGLNEDTNMQLLCPTCNRQKHAKHPIDFMQSKGYLL